MLEDKNLEIQWGIFKGDRKIYYVSCKRCLYMRNWSLWILLLVVILFLYIFGFVINLDGKFYKGLMF